MRLLKLNRISETYVTVISQCDVSQRTKSPRGWCQSSTTFYETTGKLFDPSEPPCPCLWSQLKTVKGGQ